MEHLPPFLLWPGASRDGRMAVGKRSAGERRRGFGRKSAENDDGGKSLVFVLTERAAEQSSR